MSTPKYTTAAALKVFRPAGSTTDLDWAAWDDSELEAKLCAIETLFEKSLNDRWDQWSETIYASGNGKPKLFLPQNANWPYRLRAVTSVKEVGFNQTTVVRIFTQGTDFMPEAHFLRTNENVSNRIRMTAGGLISDWPEGRGNIQIVGDWGHDSVPVELIRAIHLMAIVNTLGEGYAGFTVSSGGAGVSSEKWDDYSVEYDDSGTDSAAGGGGDTVQVTAFSEVNRLLTPLMNLVGLFQTP